MLMSRDSAESVGCDSAEDQFDAHTPSGHVERKIVKISISTSVSPCARCRLAGLCVCVCVCVLEGVTELCLACRRIEPLGVKQPKQRAA